MINLKTLLRRKILGISILVISLLSCRTISVNDAVWNENEKVFQKDLVQLGYLKPYFYVEEFVKNGDSVNIVATTNIQWRPKNVKKFLLSCDENGGILDTIKIYKNDSIVNFSYKMKNQAFFVLIDQECGRGNYLTEKTFIRQSR